VDLIGQSGGDVFPEINVLWCRGKLDDGLARQMLRWDAEHLAGGAIRGEDAQVMGIDDQDRFMHAFDQRLPGAVFHFLSK